MRAHQKAHIASTWKVIASYLEEMRGVAERGIAGDGTRFTPLPRPVRDNFLAILERISSGLQDVRKALLPEWIERGADRRDPGATKMWLVTLILLLDEQIADLDPRTMAPRYGAMPDEAAETLRRYVTQLRAEVRAALETLDRSKQR